MSTLGFQAVLCVAAKVCFNHHGGFPGSAANFSSDNFEPEPLEFVKPSASAFRNQIMYVFDFYKKLYILSIDV